MTDDPWLDPQKDPSQGEVAFDYIKAEGFRTIWVDGAIGSATPHGLVHFALYAERPAIPRRQVFALEMSDETTGKLGLEVVEKRIARKAIVREMACDVFLSLETAENIGNWLLERVREMKKGGGKE
jgi:hypothetical protein